MGEPFLCVLILSVIASVVGRNDVVMKLSRSSNFIGSC